MATYNVLIEIKRSVLNKTKSYGRNSWCLFSSVFVSADMLDTSNNNNNINKPRCLALSGTIQLRTVPAII
jgi:hypothetical protein